MTPKHLEYPLTDGYIDRWLVYGPLATRLSIKPGRTFIDTAEKAAIAESWSVLPPNLPAEPLEGGYAFVPGNEALWKYFHAREDHLIDVSTDYATFQKVELFAYTQLLLPAAGKAKISIEVNGPVDFWVNDTHVFRAVDFPAGMQSYLLDLDLGKENKILARFSQIGMRSCLNLLRVRVEHIEGIAMDEIQVTLPTRARQPGRFMELEKNLEKAHLEEVVNYKGAKFNLRWAEGTDPEFHYHYQIQDDQERIYVEGTWQPEENGTDIGHTVRLFERPFRVVLKAPPREYYELNNRYQREIPLYVIDTAYSTSPYGSYPSRRAEALKDAAKHEGSVFGQIARLVIKNEAPDESVVRNAIKAALEQHWGAEISLLGLLGFALHEIGKNHPVLVEIIRQAASEYLQIAQEEEIEDDVAEIVRQACVILAARLAGNSGLSERYSGTTAEWLRNKGRNGWRVWLSNSESEKVIAALAHLTSYAEEDTVKELAAVLLDRELFDLAVHSYKGAYLSAHGKTEAGMLKSAQLEATSGISRMLFGMGVYNPNVAGVVSLAMADYEFPTFFADIARDQRDEMLSVENHQGTTTITYRTPDYLLSSAQDFRAGEKGCDELVWQAGFGPDAKVFVTQPACSSEAPARKPGYWLGNAVLPRAAQWKDVLVAVYPAPGDGLEFTHAYFPLYRFDEYTLRDGWAFARKGSGYLALTAARGLELVKEGPGGYQELRSYGHPNIWICQMGREAQDGSFADFQKAVGSMRLEWPENKVRFTNLRGETIVFGLEGDLIVNDAPIPLVSTKALENPYCRAEIGSAHYEIGFDGLLMRLSFE